MRCLKILHMTVEDLDSSNLSFPFCLLHYRLYKTSDSDSASLRYGLKPFVPSGPRGWRIVINFGPSSSPMLFSLDINLSGRWRSLHLTINKTQVFSKRREMHFNFVHISANVCDVQGGLMRMPAMLMYDGEKFNAKTQAGFQVVIQIYRVLAGLPGIARAITTAQPPQHPHNF